MLKSYYSELLKRIFSAAILVTTLITAFIFSATSFAILLFLILLIILIFEWKNLIQDSTLLHMLTPIYPTSAFIFLIALTISNYYPLVPILFAIVWTFDTTAYFIGKKWGKNIILPSISPGKTWQGAIGGLLITLLSTLFFTSYKNIAKTIYVIIITCILALTGDLFESYLKRRVNLKDSGYFLPGHGGLLDRFDGILAVAPFFYFFKSKLILLFF